VVVAVLVGLELVRLITGDIMALEAMAASECIRAFLAQMSAMAAVALVPAGRPKVPRLMAVGFL
jgi:hypothetical protein